VPDGKFDVLGDSLGLVDRVAVFRDRANHAEVVHLLERTAAQVLEWTLPTDDQDRRIRAPRVGDPGHAVRHTGAGGDRCHADLARVAARP